MIFLHKFLCCIMLLSGFLVSFSTNPIESVLFLILTFCNAAAILFIFNAEFIGLTFIIIYVGAIAVLFLFVIMMLNIKNTSGLTLKYNLFSFLVYFSFFYFFSFSIFLCIKKVFYQQETFLIEQENNLLLLVDSLNNIDIMGQFLYNYYLVCFLLAGLILLIALVGSIVLTLRFDSMQKNQLANRQLARTDKFLSFFK